MDLITKNYSWEQVIYEIIAAEGLDPWNLNLNSLASSFMEHIGKMKNLDFRIPAKYIIISSVLLRMKSDFLQFLDIGLSEEIDYEISDDMEMEEIDNQTVSDALDVAISVPAKRRPHRKVVVTDLIDSLKKVLATNERKNIRIRKRAEKLKIDYEKSITKRIEELYERISSLLDKIKKDNIKFSEIVPKWERKEIIDNFLPLIHLDNQKKINCTQEEFFEDILIKKVN